MLSFLREERFENGKTAKQSGDETANRPAVPSADRQQEYLTVTAQDKNVRKTTMLLAVLFGIGLLCLWFMIKKSTPQTAQARSGGISTEETQIEMAITRLTGVRSEMFKGIERIVKKFYEFSDVQQVEVDELAKNPFMAEKFMGNIKEKSDSEESDYDIYAEIMARQAEGMQLLSIMTTDASRCCMIDDRILYEGDSVRGFNVHQIGDNFVKLRSGDAEIILKLSE